MRIASNETIIIQPEQVRLVRRATSKKWQVHYKIEGIKTWFRRSTETDDVDKARAIAQRVWMKATFDHEEGRPIISKRFKPVAEVVLNRLKAEISAGTAKPAHRDYVSALNLYLIPFYGKYNVDGITPAIISTFHEWRREEVGRELSGSAQNNHNAAFNLVLDEAIERGYMTEYQRPATKNTGSESKRRPDFSQDELMTLARFASTYVQNGRTDRTRMIRDVLARAYVPFLAATGIRPGTETEHLEWRHIEVEVRDGQPILHFRLQKGKRGARNFVAHNSCWRVLDYLRQISPDLSNLTLEEVIKQKPALKLFRLADGSVPDNWNKPFRQYLEEANLLNFPITGDERSLYCMRHYYATQRLLEGIPTHDLAKQMGTSELMINKHYSHLTPLMKAGQFAGTVDANSTSPEAAQIRSIMAAQMANNNIMSFVQMSTELTIPLAVQSDELKKDFEQRLKQAHSPQVI